MDRPGRADDLAYGYEEALGYCVLPDVVRDKDGITAALLVADLAAALKADGRTLLDRLDELAAEFGLHATAPDLGPGRRPAPRSPPRWPRCGPDPPTHAARPAGRPPSRTCCPDADVLRLRADGVRVVVRPSGTEPKLKAYLEVVGPIPAGRDALRAELTPRLPPPRRADSRRAVDPARRRASASIAGEAGDRGVDPAPAGSASDGAELAVAGVAEPRHDVRACR